MQHARLTALAEVIADGSAPDWDAAETSAPDDEKILIRHLRLASGIAQARAVSYLSSLSARELTAAGPLAPGTVWGPLRILEHVGRGHFGHVYRAFDSTLDREVALKLLHQRASDDASAGAVIEEGRLMARVRHPNVVTIHGAQRVEDRVGLWMEFIRGATLEAELQQRGWFTPQQVADIGLELCAALEAVHSAGLVHRDVKTQNILRDASGRVVLGDFGTGRELVEGDPGERELVGTPAYAAPEVFSRGEASCQSDIYSLGVVLFHLATGSFPVKGTSIGEIREAHVSGRRTSLRSVQPEIPAGLAAVIERAIDSVPEQRFSDASEMRKGIAGWQASARRRRRMPLWITAAVAAAGLIATTVWSWSTRSLHLRPSSRILVADFENATRDPLLNSYLTFELQRELVGSPFVSVVPREHVQDLLRLTRRTPDTAVSMALADELAQRDGNIQALVAGRIEQAGTGYEITVRVARPLETAAAKAVTERASSHADLLVAPGRVSRRVRELLGETRASVEQSVGTPPRVTTSSFHALQLYWRAEALMSDESGQRAVEAEQLLRQAIQEDAEFASAYMLLCGAIGLQPGDRGDEVWAAAGRAFELAHVTSGVERLYLDARYHEFQSLPRMQLSPSERNEARKKAAAGYEAVLRAVPSYRAAHERLLLMYEQLNRRSDVRKLVGLMVNARPNSFYWVGQAAIEAMREGDIAMAREYAVRAQALPSPAYSRGAPFNVVQWIRLFPVRDAWLRNDVRLASDELDREAATLASVGTDVRSDIANGLFHAYRALGRLTAAEALLPMVATPTARRLGLELLIDRDDLSGVRTFLRSRGPSVSEADSPGERQRATMQLIDAYGVVGDVRNARGLFTRERAILANHALRIDGELALLEGRVDDTIALLGKVPYNGIPGLRVALTLADAWTEKGDHNQALQLLENASASRVQLLAGSFESATLWLRVRARLAALYRKAGRDADAAAIEQELRDLLAVADDDHPVKRRFASLPR